MGERVNALPQRAIGSWSVAAIGLGCMPLSFSHMTGKRDQAIATIHRALDLGITLLDTANIYAPSWDTMGHNEELVADALSQYEGCAELSRVLVTTKGGITRSEGEVWGRDSSESALQDACKASMSALGVTVIDLYQHHRNDPAMTFADQIHSLNKLRDLGWVREVGLSNVTLPELLLALEILGGPGAGGVVSVQNEFSPRYRGDRDVLDRCTELGIAFLPWSPLGGSDHARDLASEYSEFSLVGTEHGVSPQEIALAWLLRLSPVVIPIPGATKPTTIDSIVHAMGIELTDNQWERLNSTESLNESMYPDDMPRSPLR